MPDDATSRRARNVRFSMFFFQNLYTNRVRPCVNHVPSLVYGWKEICGDFTETSGTLFRKYCSLPSSSGTYATESGSRSRYRAYEVRFVPRSFYGGRGTRSDDEARRNATGTRRGEANVKRAARRGRRPDQTKRGEAIRSATDTRALRQSGRSGAARSFSMTWTRGP